MRPKHGDEMLEHTTHPRLLSDKVGIVLVGAGGNGSQMLTGLARLHTAIRALGHPGLEVVVYDPDDVSQANLGRQLFAEADVGRNKAQVLVTRLNAWFGLQWQAMPERFGHGSHGSRGHHEPVRTQIVISCVDSAAARQEIDREIESWYSKPYYWLDLGNRAADGQVVLGIPPWNSVHAAYEYRLPTVVELFREIYTGAADLDRDNGPSCSLAQALERQELFVNQAIVTPALQLLWSIFRRGRTSWCGCFVNLDTGRMTPIPIDSAAWARMGYVRPPEPSARLRAEQQTRDRDEAVAEEEEA